MTKDEVLENYWRSEICHHVRVAEHTDGCAWLCFYTGKNSESPSITVPLQQVQALLEIYNLDPGHQLLTA